MVVLAAGMVPTTVDEATINLAYRQGPGFLDLDLFDGYADSHFICFPYETRRTGVYACGGVRKAETMEETIDDATGAALKRFSVLNLLIAVLLFIRVPGIRPIRISFFSVVPSVSVARRNARSVLWR